MSSVTTTTTRRKRKSSSGRSGSMKKRRLFSTALAPTSRITNFINQRGPFGARTVVRLKYHTTATTPGTIMDRLFNLNSVFDPDLSLTGHQPYGYGTYETIYNRYRVFRVDYHMEVASTVANSMSKMTLIANNSAALYTNPDLAAESPGAITKTFYQGKPVVFRGSVFPNQVSGVTPEQYKSDDRYQALCSASPGENIVHHLVISDMVNGALAAGVAYQDITYIFHVEFFDPLELAQS